MHRIADLLSYLNDFPIPGSGFYPDPQQRQVTAHFTDLQLTSVFQPIFAPDGITLRSHEGLLRAQLGGVGVPPDAAFASVTENDSFMHLDRLCRTLHILNFLAQDGRQQLNLNLHPRHVLSVTTNHGKVFESILHWCKLPTRQITLEVLESAISDSHHLKDAVDSYRQRGYRIAIDDFGKEHSNFDRLWQLNPDEVKFDRHMIALASEQSTVRRVLPKLVEIVHELGAEATCEGIETREQCQIAQDAGFDGLQGYYLQRPSPTLRH